MILLAILFFFYYIYAILFIIIIIIRFINKKKIAWRWVIGNLVLIGLFIFLQKLIDDHKLIFTGKYIESHDWGAGLANLATVINNEVILMMFFCVAQVVLVSIYRSKSKRNLSVDRP